MPGFVLFYHKQGRDLRQCAKHRVLFAQLGPLPLFDLRFRKWSGRLCRLGVFCLLSGHVQSPLVLLMVIFVFEFGRIAPNVCVVYIRC